MQSVELIGSVITWGMNAEYSKMQASANNISNINRPGSSFSTTTFKESLAEFRASLREGDAAGIRESVSKRVGIVPLAEAEVSLDKEVEHLASSQLRYEVLAELYQRRMELKNTIFNGAK